MLWLEDLPTLGILDTHATIVVDRRKTASTTFHTLFTEFVQELKESEYPEGYVESGAVTKLTKAYWAFLNCLGTEVGKSAEPVSTYHPWSKAVDVKTDYSNHAGER
jgi:hypothetical protein